MLLLIGSMHLRLPGKIPLALYPPWQFHPHLWLKLKNMSLRMMMMNSGVIGVVIPLMMMLKRLAGGSAAVEVQTPSSSSSSSGSCSDFSHMINSSELGILPPPSAEQMETSFVILLEEMD